MKRLLNSAKFWLVIVDVACSTVLYFVGKYAGASLEDVKFIIVTYQPVFALVITGIFVEDAAQKVGAARATPIINVSHEEAQG